MLIQNEAAQVHALRQLSDKLDNLNINEEVSGIKMDAESFEKIIKAISNNNNNNSGDSDSSDYDIDDMKIQELQELHNADISEIHDNINELSNTINGTISTLETKHDNDISALYNAIANLQQSINALRDKDLADRLKNDFVVYGKTFNNLIVDINSSFELLKKMIQDGAVTKLSENTSDILTDISLRAISQSCPFLVLQRSQRYNNFDNIDYNDPNLYVEPVYDYFTTENIGTETIDSLNGFLSSIYSNWNTDITSWEDWVNFDENNEENNDHSPKQAAPFFMDEYGHNDYIGYIWIRRDKDENGQFINNTPEKVVSKTRAKLKSILKNMFNYHNITNNGIFNKVDDGDYPYFVTNDAYKYKVLPKTDLSVLNTKNFGSMYNIYERLLTMFFLIFNKGEFEEIIDAMVDECVVYDPENPEDNTIVVAEMFSEIPNNNDMYRMWRSREVIMLKPISYIYTRGIDAQIINLLLIEYDEMTVTSQREEKVAEIMNLLQTKKMSLFNYIWNNMIEKEWIYCNPLYIITYKKDYTEFDDILDEIEQKNFDLNTTTDMIHYTVNQTSNGNLSLTYNLLTKNIHYTISATQTLGSMTFNYGNPSDSDYSEYGKIYYYEELNQQIEMFAGSSVTLYDSGNIEINNSIYNYVNRDKLLILVKFNGSSNDSDVVTLDSQNHVTNTDGAWGYNVFTSSNNPANNVVNNQWRGFVSVSSFNVDGENVSMLENVEIPSDVLNPGESGTTRINIYAGTPTYYFDTTNLANEIQMDYETNHHDAQNVRYVMRTRIDYLYYGFNNNTPVSLNSVMSFDTGSQQPACIGDRNKKITCTVVASGKDME